MIVLVRGLFLTEDRISLLAVLRLFFFFLDPVSAAWVLLITLLVALVATVPMAALARGMRKDMSCIPRGEILSVGVVSGRRSDQVRTKKKQGMLDDSKRGAADTQVFPQ